MNLPLGYGVQLEIINKSPCNVIIYPKATNKEHYQHNSKDNVFNKEQLKVFLNVCKDIDINYYTYYRLLSFSGLRPAEGLVQFKDIRGNYLTVSKTTHYDRANKEVIITSPKTKGSKRTINLDDDTLQAINDNSFIFTAKQGRLYSSADLISWLRTIYSHCPDGLPRLTNLIITSEKHMLVYSYSQHGLILSSYKKG